MPNRYSNFPNGLDELKLLPEVQEMTNVVKQKIARYNELALKVSLTAEEEIELQTLINETKDFQLNSADWNKTNGVLMETQRYIKETVLGDIGRIVDAGEVEINTVVTNGKTNIQQTVVKANSDIDVAKHNTMLQLDQKVADVISKGNVGIDHFKNRVVLTQNSPTVKVNIEEYNRSTDFLMVFINGLMAVEGINYTMDNDDITIRAIGGSWETGDEFDFVDLKRTVIISDRYDAGLFADGTIRKEKLNLGLQNEITTATTDIVSIKEDIITKNNNVSEQLETKMDKAVRDEVTDKRYKIGIMNGLLYYREVVE